MIEDFFSDVDCPCDTPHCGRAGPDCVKLCVACHTHPQYDGSLCFACDRDEGMEATELRGKP